MMNKLVFVAALLCLITVPCIAGEGYTIDERDQIVVHGDQEFYGFAEGAFAGIGEDTRIGFDYINSILSVTIILDEYPESPSDFGYYFYLASIKCDDVAKKYPGKISNVWLDLEVDGERIAQMRTSLPSEPPVMS